MFTEVSLILFYANFWDQKLFEYQKENWLFLMSTHRFEIFYDLYTYENKTMLMNKFYLGIRT